MKNTIWNKRLPSIFGLFFLLFAVGTISWLSRNVVLFGTKAAAGNIPKEVKVSNISDTAFTVSYVTDSNVAGTITFGQLGKIDQVALDNRDKSQATPKEHTIHYVTVSNLSPSTTYAFTITSGDKNFLNGNAAYQVTTAKKDVDAPSDENAIVKGKITTDTGASPTEAIAYLSTADSGLLSTLVDASGGYQFDLNMMRNAELSSFMVFNPDTILKLDIVNNTNVSHVSLLKNQINPVPIIILSKDYDFTISTEPLAPSPVASESAATSDEPSVSPVAFPTANGQVSTAPNIATPQDEQSFKDQKPLFQGKAVPNETISITVNSAQTITTTVKADKNGNWQYRPDVPLDPGPHTITIKTIDASGIMKTITRSFVVYAEGSQFTEPSVSPAASPTSTPTPLPQATNTPAPTTAVTTPTTAIITTTPTPTTVVTIAASESPSITTPPVPVTGNTTLILTIISIVSAVTIGALLFFVMV